MSIGGGLDIGFWVDAARLIINQDSFSIHLAIEVRSATKPMFSTDYCLLHQKRLNDLALGPFQILQETILGKVYLIRRVVAGVHLLPFEVRQDHGMGQAAHLCQFVPILGAVNALKPQTVSPCYELRLGPEPEHSCYTGHEDTLRGLIALMGLDPFADPLVSYHLTPSDEK